MIDTYSVREQRAWYMYDWANSAFFSTVVTLFLGPYLTALARNAAGADGRLLILGLSIDPRSLWSYLISISVVTQVICLPLLGALADYSGRKKQLLFVFTYIGAGATICMYALNDGRYVLGSVLFLIANLTAGASVVLYNAFLPEIAPEDQRDNVSSKGWGIGYLGGGLLLALNLVLYSNAARLGLEESHAVRISLASAGLWWAVFAILPMMRLRSRRATRSIPPGESLVGVGFRQLWHTFKDLRHYRLTLLFLVAFLIYNDAIQAVITLSGQFGSDYLKIPMGRLTLAILMVQFLAFVGAMAFNYLARWTSAKRAVCLSLVMWTLLMGYMYTVTTERGFFLAAAIVAIIMGGSQALSRSMFSQMIPPGREAEYFSLYEVSDKGTSWLAPLIFGLTLDRTGSYQYAILSLVVFFVAGLLILLRVDVARAARAARA